MIRPAYAFESESALVVRAAAGDDRAFGELVARREPNLRRLLRRLCGNAALADDLAQQAFVRAWRSMASLQSAAAFGGWLNRIAVNAWLQSRRKAGADMEPLEDDPVDPAREAQGVEARIDLERALGLLKPAERVCIVLNHGEGHSHGEIAEITGLPLGTVKSHVTRGAARLRVLLGVEGRSHEPA